MRKLILLLFPLALCLASIGQDCHRAYWVDGYDGSQAQEFFIDIDRHPEGGFVVLGKHSADGTTLGNQNTNPGVASYYLARMDSAGNFSQLTSVLPQGGITIKRITVMPDGSVAAGCTVSSNIALGSETFHLHGGAKPLLVKFDAQFNYLWHRAAENSSNTSDVRDISCDSQGNIYWGGLFSGDYLSFGGDFYLHRISDGGAWFSKVNSQGQFQWIRGIAPGVSAGLQTVTVDSNDDVWISGQATVNANGQLKFSDEVIAPGYLNSGFCVYIGKFSPDGQCVWGKISSSTSSFGSVYTADAMRDDQGNMYICGQIIGTYEWSGMPMLGGDGSGYVMSLDTDGNGRWFKTMGGQGSYEQATNLDVRGDRVAVIGALSSNQPYVGNFPVYALASGTYKAFNAQFYTNGELEFCRMNQTDTQNFLQHDVVIDEGYNQLVFGYYKGTNIAWYPINLTHTGTNPKKFVAKYGPSAQTTFTISAGPDKTTTCGTNVQLNGSTTPSNGVGFGWWPDMGFSSNYSKTPIANTSEPRNYIFYGHYQGCIKRDTVFVALSNFNGLNIDAGSDQTICVGDTVALGAVSSDPAATIVWSPSYRLTSSTALNTNSFTNTSLNYVVEATVGNCKSRDTVYVHVHRKPAIVLPYQQFYQSYQMHTCIDLPIYADLGSSENTYSFSDESHITWQNDHSVIFNTDAFYYGGQLVAVSPEGCENELTFTVHVYDYQPGPPILNQPNDTIYLCPASGFVYEEEFMISADIPYLPEEFNFSWYGGWQVDSLDGLGWRDIEIWNYGHYELFPNSVGNPTSAYYVPLRFWNVEPEMDGYRYRAYINDICSPRVYTDQMVLRVGPAFTDQTSALIVCEGATDTLFVEAANNTGVYQWQVWRDSAWTDLTADETHLQIQNNQLIVVNVTAGMDSLFRCRIEGCSPALFTYSDEIALTVQPNDISVSGPFQSEGCLGENIALHVEATGGTFDVQWMRDGIALTANSVGHGGINNDTLWINTALFNPIGHEYSCQLFNTQCGQNFNTDIWNVDLDIPVSINWELNDNSLCIDDDLLFVATASPEGGVYNGPGLNDLFLNPAQVGPGSYALTYTYTDEGTGCICSAEQTVTVWELPAIQMAFSHYQACINSTNSIQVFASPANGTISAPGLDFDMESSSFTVPSSAGTFIVDFTYTSAQGCTNSTNSTFYALDTTTISWEDELGVFCTQANSAFIPLPSPAGGVFSGFEVQENNLILNYAEAGSYALNYTINDANGCSSTRTATFDVQEITVQWTDSLLAGCISGDPIFLGNPTPAGGFFAHPAVTGQFLDPSVSGVGFHAVTYVYIDPNTGCSGSQTQYIQVYDLPVVSLADLNPNFCLGSPSLPLTEGSPSGGVYSGDGVLENTQGEFMLDLPSMEAGSYTMNYAYTNPGGCSSSAAIAFTVHPTPTINWVDELGTFCAENTSVVIPMPTPNGGSFSDIEVDGNNLLLNNLAAGTYGLTYTVTDANGCTSAQTGAFSIQDIEVQWVASSLAGCIIGEPIPLGNPTPIGGTFIGDAVTEGAFYPALAGIGFHPVTYVYTDPITGCTESLTQEVQVYDQPDVSFSTSMTDFCEGSTSLPLEGGSPSGGTYAGDGVTAISEGQYMLETANLPSDEYTISYTYTDNAGCSNTATVNYTIHSNPTIAWAEDLGSFCTNSDEVQVALPAPAGGEFSPALTESGLLTIAGMSSGTYDLQYTYIDAFGCIGQSSAAYTINDTLAIGWTSSSPGEPNNGFSFCGNLTPDAQADLTAYATPLGGDFYNMDDYLENNVWTWGDFFEPGFYPITYTVDDPFTGCTSTSIQEFELILCGAVTAVPELSARCWTDGRQHLWIESPAAGRYELINNAGQIVSSGPMNAGMQVTTHSIAAGWYVVRLFSGERQINQKIVIGL